MDIDCQAAIIITGVCSAFILICLIVNLNILDDINNKLANVNKNCITIDEKVYCESND